MQAERGKRCSRCKLLISFEEFDWHFKKYHSSSQETSTEAAEDLENFEDYDEDWLPWEKNIDATKNYGYSCREEGKYGSLPGHDGFDDESTP